MNLPYAYYAAVLDAITDVSNGETLTRACDDNNVSVATFHKYIKGSPELAEMYEEAVQRGLDAMADALVHIDNDERFGHTDPKMAKVVSDNIKWLISKRDPERFGDRIEVRQTVSVDLAITSRLNAARTRLVDVEDAEVLDVTTALYSEPEPQTR